MRLLMALVGALALAACGDSDTTTIETEDGTAEYRTDNDSGEAEMRFTDDDGNETFVTSRSDLEADLPEGFSIYPGAEVVTNTVVSGNDGQGSLIIMTSSASVEEMTAFYRRQAVAAGIEFGMEMTSGANRIISGEGPDGETFSFNASTSEGRTTAMLTMSRAPGE
ncbi:hypothetical protein [Erythrobacter alti]|uniref:hypothetical protein n=1 Tax=Erythrobacter alti TaxID=1896145 RepID=UPI0030F3C361